MNFRDPWHWASALLVGFYFLPALEAFRQWALALGARWKGNRLSEEAATREVQRDIKRSGR